MLVPHPLVTWASVRTVLELLAAHGAVVGYGAPLVTLHNTTPP